MHVLWVLKSWPGTLSKASSCSRLQLPPLQAGMFPVHGFKSDPVLDPDLLEVQGYGGSSAGYEKGYGGQGGYEASGYDAPSSYTPSAGQKRSSTGAAAAATAPGGGSGDYYSQARQVALPA